jgi:hypothetical protein
MALPDADRYPRVLPGPRHADLVVRPPPGIGVPVLFLGVCRLTVGLAEPRAARGNLELKAHFRGTAELPF